MPTSQTVTQLMATQREWDDRGWFPPGPQLAICLPDQDRLADLTDTELIEVMAAARRQTAWAQSRELAAIAELSARRHHKDDQNPDNPDHRRLTAHESLIEEISVAVAVTGNTAATLIHLADRLHTALPGTRAALQAGLIDLPKARILVEATDRLSDPVCQQVEAALLPQADARTTGQLRRRATTVVRALAPQQHQQQVEATLAHRRLEHWDTATGGVAALALLDVPAADANAIYRKLTAAAQAIHTDGDPRSHDQLRSDLALTLLRGHSLPQAIHTLLTNPAPEPARTGAADRRPAPVSEEPARAATAPHTGDAALPAALAAQLDQQLTGLRSHLRAAGRLPQLPELAARAIQELHRRLTPYRDTWCPTTGHTGLDSAAVDTVHGHRRYRPPTALRKMIEERHPTCTFPTCNQPSRRCDLDHTLAHHAHGPTCGCNLAPLCRRHHRTKQTLGWRLFQPWPGLLIWITPTGTWHIILPRRE